MARNILIRDRFLDVSGVGANPIPFKMAGNKPPPEHVPIWRINRSNSRSMGKKTYLHTKPSLCCKSLVRRVYDNSCFECWSKK